MADRIATLAGFAPALPTPFTADDTIDTAAFEHLCARQIDEGAAALVVCGTTGEAPVLTPAEQETLIRIAASVSHGRVPVIAGTGSNATARAIALTRTAEAAGADAALSVVPYYNKPSQAGLVAHFGAIARTTGLPTILYDVPSRTGCGLADDTVAMLAENPRIVGLKDAAGDVTRPLRLRPRLGATFRLLSGDDATALAYLALGGDGCISVTTNLAPGLCRNLTLALHQGQTQRARCLAGALAPLTAALFCETNPAPLKYALGLLGLMSPRLRLPLVEPSAPAKAALAAALAQIYDSHPEDVIGRLAHPALDGRAVA